MELTEEQRLIRDTVGALAQARFAPAAASADKEYRPPIENLKVLAEHGYTGVFLPETYGGAGLGLLETVLIVEQLARSCANTAMLFSCTDGATPRAILHIGSDDIRRRYLPAFARAERYAAWSMSEANAGSDVGNVQTRAVLRGDHYVVNGSKLWCSGAQVADVFLVLVRLSDEPGMKGVGALLVERGAPGFSVGRHLDLLGLRGTGMAELVFQDCPVPAGNLLLPPGRMKDLLQVFDADRIIGNPPICLGLAHAALAQAAQHLKDRVQFGRPLADNQGLQWKLADMAIDLEAARALVYAAAASLDRGQHSVAQVSIAKTYANEMAVRVTNQAMQLAGAFGLSEEYPFERYFRDARGMSIGYGTTEIHRNVIAREILKGNYLA
ncbi:Acryloyl-CoA reductase (NADH) [Achromobacter deleyi]|uniref:Acryloyl-CoA reductase (NADH) n=1 Tax=Achromobacter deleyi TaxID=1353891 RepID=A0A6S7A8Z2_9BURK|nr:acyl-CoA dehydrogenase family protein [Achromobacter deleyi]CAB3707643.1 Acryloyl-CoA reductase (NADH) [Achromobacter deleyi]CAB3836418.1 Acryloyl-CoA reductase (NADH) [Achromobacter deleyi]CAB3865695.1 Acryloyl-CoA reductase (NADH) [Achromobacter deleyi]CAB3878546.1 Acryloyl-CoA reductase (NADH) [Achromobacter deleyi]